MKQFQSKKIVCEKLTSLILAQSAQLAQKAQSAYSLNFIFCSFDQKSKSVKMWQISFR